MTNRTTQELLMLPTGFPSQTSVVSRWKRQASEIAAMSECLLKEGRRALFNRVALITALLMFAHVASAADKSDVGIKRLYKNLIDAENKHDLIAVTNMVWNSASILFVAKAPAGWQGYWGIDDVIGHLHDMYQGTFRIDPIYEEEKVVFITRDVAETYAPVKITVAYAGQNPVPKPFIMVLVWIKTPKGWKMATDIPIPIPPDPAP